MRNTVYIVPYEIHSGNLIEYELERKRQEGLPSLPKRPDTARLGADSGIPISTSEVVEGCLGCTFNAL